MKNKKIINICIFMVIICFALSGCSDKKKENENIATSTDTESEVSEEVTTEKADKNTTETTTNKVTTEESKTTEKEAAKDKTTATTTETSKPQTTQAPATTEAPKPQTTQTTTEAPKPQTTQAPATTQQATTEAPSTTEHQHNWESIGHTETHDYRTDTGADVTGQQIVVHNGQECIITGYTGVVECGVCGAKFSTNQEMSDHRWNVHEGAANSITSSEPIYVSVTQKSIYVEDYQRCSTCGATK